MHRLKSLSLTKLLSAVLAIALFALTPQSAFAGKAHLYGSNAWTKGSGGLLSGPGAGYALVGSLEAETRVLVDRCTMGWCQLRSGGQAGWFPLHRLDFGQFTVWNGPRLNYPSGGPGYVCFFSGNNFSGSSFCSGPRTYVRDLALLGRDNQVRSVQVVGNASAIVCADFNLTSYCVRVVQSEQLPDGLRGSVTSYRVY